MFSCILESDLVALMEDSITCRLINLNSVLNNLNIPLTDALVFFELFLKKVFKKRERDKTPCVNEIPVTTSFFVFSYFQDPWFCERWLKGMRTRSVNILE